MVFMGPLCHNSIRSPIRELGDSQYRNADTPRSDPDPNIVRIESYNGVHATTVSPLSSWTRNRSSESRIGSRFRARSELGKFYVMNHDELCVVVRSKTWRDVTETYGVLTNETLVLGIPNPLVFSLIHSISSTQLISRNRTVISSVLQTFASRISSCEWLYQGAIGQISRTTTHSSCHKFWNSQLSPSAECFLSGPRSLLTD